MPHYIFTKVNGDPTWELVEAVNGTDVAKKALADYRSFLKKQVGAEVVMLEADTAAQAREKLERDPEGS